MAARSKLLVFATLVSVSLAAQPASAITIGPDFVGSYTATDLGAIAGLPVSYGGMVFKAGDPGTILIGGAANTAGGGLYEVPVVRDGSNHIIGLGAATLVGTAPYNDGGFAYGPGGVLFLSQWPSNMLSQYLPGNEAAPDKVVDLTPLGVAGSNSAINFVPAGFLGAGQAKAVSWAGGEWYTLTLAPDGLGTYDVTLATFHLSLGGGPEGFVFIDGANPGFGVDSLLINEWGDGKVAVYDLDANGDPVLASRRDFITDLSGAEGAAIDPLTGDFLFSTFGGGDRIVVVQGFTVVPPTSGIAEPMSLALFAIGLAGIAVVRRKCAA